MPEIFIDTIKTQVDKVRLPNDNFLIADIVNIQDPVSERAPYHITLKDGKGDEILAALFPYSKYADTDEKKKKLKDLLDKIISLKGKKVKITNIGRKTSFQDKPQIQLNTSLEIEEVSKQIIAPTPTITQPQPISPQPVPTQPIEAGILAPAFNKLFSIQSKLKIMDDGVKDIQMEFEQLYNELKKVRGDKDAI